MSDENKKSVEGKDESFLVKDSLEYKPTHFMRAHSKNNNPSDISTPIWEVVFELGLPKLLFLLSVELLS